jgi:hypothetical protein
MPTNKYYAGSSSDHFDGLRFFNLDQIDTDRSLRDVLRWKFKETAARWPASVPGRQVLPDERVAGLRVTMVGHATVLIQSGSLNVLTDPVWSARCRHSPICRRSTSCCSATTIMTIWTWTRCASCTPHTGR